MNAADTLFHRELRKRLDEESKWRSEAVSANAAADLEDYRHRTGQIAGIKLAADLCEEIEKKLNERNT